MANMSYCRFENTLRDLRDCEDALRDGESDGLSEHEEKAKRKLINLCIMIAKEYGPSSTSNALYGVPSSELMLDR